MNNIYIEFVYVPTGETVEVGPFPFAQITHNIIRVGEDGEEEIGYFDNGMWEYNDQLWTDVIFSSR